MIFLDKIKLPGFLYFVRFFLIFVQKNLIFLTWCIKNICRNATKKEFCQNHVWFLSYLKFSDFKCKKSAPLKLFFEVKDQKLILETTTDILNFLYIFIWYKSPLCLGGCMVSCLGSRTIRNK